MDIVSAKHLSLFGGNSETQHQWATCSIQARGPFLESPENVSGLESKISNLTITELLYSHILNMKRDVLHTRSFTRKHFYAFRYK